MIQYRFWEASESYTNFFAFALCQEDSMFQRGPSSSLFPEWANNTQSRIAGDPQSKHVILGRHNHYSCNALRFKVIFFLRMKLTMKLTLGCQLYFILFYHCYCPWTSILTCNVYPSTQGKKGTFMANIFLVIQLPYTWKSYCECLFCFCVSFTYQKLLFE